MPDHKDEVLSAFQKISPSTISIEEQDTFSDYLYKHETLFRYRLRFPPELFRNASVIDFGCGTGEVDIVLATWGASICGFDFNPISIDRAVYLRKSFNLDSQLSFFVDDVDSFHRQNFEWRDLVKMHQRLDELVRHLENCL